MVPFQQTCRGIPDVVMNPADHQRPEALVDANRGVQQSREVCGALSWVFRSLGTGGDLRCSWDFTFVLGNVLARYVVCVTCMTL
jgi:hypothetical protein